MRHVARGNRPDVTDTQATEHAPLADTAPIATRRRMLLGLGLIIVLAVGLTLLLSKAAGFENVAQVLGSADVGWMAVCLAFEVVSWVGYVLVIWSVVDMDGGLRLRGWHAVRIWLVSLGGTRIVSPAGAGGVATTYWLLRHTGMQPRSVAQRVLAISIVVFAIFGIMAFAASVAATALGPEAPLGMTLPWIIGVPLIAAWGAWVGMPGRAERVMQPRGTNWAWRAVAAAASGVVATRAVLLRPRTHALPIVAAVAYWAFDVLSLWAALRAVGADVPILAVGMGYAVGYLALLFPLPTGGYGAIDAATIFALTALDLPLAQTLAGVVVWRAFSFWLPTIPALIELARIRDLGRVLEMYSGTAPEIT